MTKFVVDYFELTATSTAKSADFFTAAFGWTLFAYGPDYSEIRDAGMLGAVNADALDSARAPLIGIRTDDIEAAERAIVAAGGAITRPIYTYPGGRRMFFKEPSGNELLVYQPE